MNETPGHLWTLVEAWLDTLDWPPSQRRIADHMGFSSSALTDWKYGRAVPDPDRLYRLAVLIHTPYRYVLDAVLKDQGYLDENGREPFKAVEDQARYEDIAQAARRNTKRPPRGPRMQQGD